MARPLRVQFPGALYHVTARGSERKPIFRDQRDQPGAGPEVPQPVPLYRRAKEEPTKPGAPVPALSK